MVRWSALFCLALAAGPAMPARDPSVTGTVRDAAGRPAAHAFVALLPETLDVLGGPRQRPHFARTGADGRFTFGDVPPGVYSATATCAGHGSAFAPRRAFCADGADDTLGLVLGERFGVVSGRVLGSRIPQRPMRIAASRHSDVEGDIFYGETRDGRFALALSPGTYSVRLTDSERASLARDVVLDVRGASVDLRPVPRAPRDRALADSLAEIERVDQDVRTRTTPGPGFTTIWEEMAHVDSIHEARIGALLKRRGWPSAADVGFTGVQAIWLVAQHGSESFLRACLPGITSAVRRGELPPDCLALSVDRDLMHRGEPQVYGSQLRSGPDGVPRLWTLRDSLHVDARRAKLGMEPLADYLRRFAPDTTAKR